MPRHGQCTALAASELPHTQTTQKQQALSLAPDVLPDHTIRTRHVRPSSRLKHSNDAPYTLQQPPVIVSPGRASWHQRLERIVGQAHNPNVATLRQWVVQRGCTDGQTGLCVCKPCP